MINLICGYEKFLMIKKEILIERSEYFKGLLEDFPNENNIELMETWNNYNIMNHLLNGTKLNGYLKIMAPKYANYYIIDYDPICDEPTITDTELIKLDFSMNNLNVKKKYLTFLLSPRKDKKYHIKYIMFHKNDKFDNICRYMRVSCIEKSFENGIEFSSPGEWQQQNWDLFYETCNVLFSCGNVEIFKGDEIFFSLWDYFMYGEPYAMIEYIE